MQQRLGNTVPLVGELDVSDNAIDRVLNLAAAGTLAYLGLQFCTKMDMQIGGMTADPLWSPVPNSQGAMVMRRLPDQAATADIGTQLRFSFAMQRAFQWDGHP